MLKAAELWAQVRNQGKDMLEYYREKNAKNTELSLKEWTEEKRAVK